MGVTLILLLGSCADDASTQVEQQREQILVDRAYCLTHVATDSAKTMCDYDAQQELNRLEARAAESRQAERASWGAAAAQMHQAGQSFQWMGH